MLKLMQYGPGYSTTILLLFYFTFSKLGICNNSRDSYYLLPHQYKPNPKYLNIWTIHIFKDVFVNYAGNDDIWNNSRIQDTIDWYLPSNYWFFKNKLVRHVGMPNLFTS